MDTVDAQAWLARGPLLVDRQRCGTVRARGEGVDARRPLRPVTVGSRIGREGRGSLLVDRQRCGTVRARGGGVDARRSVGPIRVG